MNQLLLVGKLTAENRRLLKKVQMFLSMAEKNITTIIKPIRIGNCVEEQERVESTPITAINRWFCTSFCDKARKKWLLLVTHATLNSIQHRNFITITTMST
jgi:hypothetical protein